MTRQHGGNERRASTSGSQSIPASNFFGSSTGSTSGASSTSPNVSLTSSRPPLVPPKSRTVSRANEVMDVDTRPQTVSRQAGLDLDGADDIPSDSEPPIEVEIEGGLEHDYAPGQRPSALTVIGASAPGYPDLQQSSYSHGHGQLTNSLLGKSSDPAFKFGQTIDWNTPYNLLDNLVDYTIVEDFVAAPPAAKRNNTASPTKPGVPSSPSTATTASASLPPPSTPTQKPQTLSYSSAVAGPSATPNIAAAARNSYFPITAQQLQAARPHPYGFYNVQTHAWSILAPFPPKNSTSPADAPCLGVNVGLPPRHHYIHWQREVDPRFLLRQSEINTPTYQRTHVAINRRTFGGPSSSPYPDPESTNDNVWFVKASPEKEWWDLYRCSVCSRAFTVSQLDGISSVLGVLLCQRFEEARRRNPSPDGPDATMREALDYIWKVLRNLLYRGERSAIPWSGTTFVKRMGDTQAGRDIFLALGFTPKADTIDGRAAFEPPEINHKSLVLLTRAFLEVSIWAAKLAGPLIAGPQQQNASNLIRLKSPLPVIEKIIGSDPIEESDPSRTAWLDASASLEIHYKLLGVTPETSDLEIYRAYLAQLLSDPTKSLWYTQALKEVSILRDSLLLQDNVREEESQNKPAFSTVEEHFKTLGCELPKTGEVFFGYEISRYPQEEVIVACFQERKDYLTMNGGTESDMKKLKDALKFVAKLGRADLIDGVLASIEPAKPEIPTFTLEEAYKHLQVTQDTEDDTVMMGVHFNLTDPTTTAFQTSRYISALETIADARNSAALRKYIQTKELPAAPLPAGVQEVEVSLDRPAGLQNIGNTCYLNSLLQYFFTFRQLREIILNYQEFQEGDVTEELLAKKRVGGRQVTKREIERSKKFVTHLQTLFSQLIHTPVPSVRPEMDLAYLALVSSKDEDEATSPALPSAPTLEAEDFDIAFVVKDAIMNSEPDSISVDASNEGLAAAQPPASTNGEEASQPMDAGSPSVLGKRRNDHLESMDIERRGGTPPSSQATLTDDFVMVDSQASQSSSVTARSVTEDVTMTSETQVPNPQATESVAQEQPASATNTGDATSASPQEADKLAPPLPARPERKSTSIVNTNMMFGRQNDVSEAMDNVIFQVEVALDDSKINSEASTSKRSFVQSLFCGTTRQILDFEDSDGQSTRLKEEPFSYLLVDVAQEGKSLYEGLDDSFASSVVEIEGKKARRQDVLTELPPILQIQLQRVQFDRATARVFKSNAYMPFPLTLRMNRYMAYDPQNSLLAEKHHQSTQLQAEIKRLQSLLLELEKVDEEKQTAPAAFRDAADALQQIRQNEEQSPEDKEFSDRIASLLIEDGDVLQGLQEQAVAIEQDIVMAKHSLESCRTQLDKLWEATDEESEYELASVFIHLGAAGYGHYYLYQRALPSQPDRWLKYNDSTVTDIDASEIFANTTGSTANPYWLTYVRKSEINARIDAICRVF